MGRARLTLKRIPNERLCKLAFMQRRKALMKKMSEFSTLCGEPKACLIVYDPNGDPQPVTWPQDLTKVHSVIENYEREKNKKPVKKFGFEDYFENKKELVEAEISKVRKEILKIKYPTWDPSFKNLGEEQLRNFVATLDTKIEGCKQRINMLKNQHQNEANFSFRQNMAQSESVASNPTQLNVMQNISLRQLIPVPMKPLDDNNRLASYIPKHDMGSQSQMPHLDPNLVQLMAKNNGVVDSTSEVDVSLDCNKQIDAVLDSTNQLDEPDWASLLGEPEDWTTQLSELMDCASLPDESVLHNIPSQSQNVQQGEALNSSMPPMDNLLPPMDGFHTDDYSNMLQAQLFDQMNGEK